MYQYKKLLPLALLLILTLPAIRPLFHSGFFTMHDDQQVVRLAELDRALMAGQFPVRWVGDLGFGYGYPLFNFYPPLVYYLGEAFHLLGFSYLFSIKLVFVAAFFSAALTMYHWARYHFGPWPAVIAALFYTYVPYHAVDAYVRGALAELFAFVWLPLILLSIDHLLSGNAPGRHFRGWSLVLSLSYAALMLTHNLIFLPFSLLLSFYLVIRLVFQPTALKQKLVSIITISSSLFMGFFLTTFFWLPALAEKQFTLVNKILLSEKYTFSLHYAQPWQLWNSLWGYGGSAPPGAIDGFTLKIGKLHLILATASLLLAIASKLYKKRFHLISKTTTVLLTAYLLLLTSAWLTTSYSSFIWDHLQPLQYLQFPWRFLTFTALFSSFIVGGFYCQLQKLFNDKLILHSSFFIIVLLLFLPNLKLFQPQTYLNVNDQYYLSDEFMKWKISGTSFEFVPYGVATHIDPDKDITQLNITKDQIATAPYSIISGQPQVSVVSNAPHQKQLQISSDQTSIIQFNTFNFPIWRADIDNSPVSISDSNPLKLIQISVPPGQHQLSIKFTNTSTRTIANLTSLLFLLLLAGTMTLNQHQLTQLIYGRRARR